MRYETIGNTKRLDAYEGKEVLLRVPSDIDGYVLTEIGSKAFFHCTQLQQLELPDGIEKIGDWAFAQMKELRVLCLPARRIAFGRNVFQGCDALQEIRLRLPAETAGAEAAICEAEEDSSACLSLQELSRFLAAWFLVLEGDCPDFAELCLPEGRRSWLAAYDMRLVQFLRLPDDIGFSPTFVGWFDIEDVDDQRLDYMAKRRRQKIELVMQRLCGNQGLSVDNQRQMQDYILCGSAHKIETIRVSTGEKIVLEPVRERILTLFAGENPLWGQELSYLQTWQKIGGFSVWGPNVLLDRMPDADPQVRSFLLGLLTGEDAADIDTMWQL